ncbi:MAG: hypothetical protein ACXWMG_02685 [Candidatus Limnocylindria bacterium]
MAAPAAKPTDADGAAEVDSGALLRDRRFVVLLAIAAVVGIIVSLAA